DTRAESVVGLALHELRDRACDSVLECVARLSKDHDVRYRLDPTEMTREKIDDFVRRRLAVRAQPFGDPLREPSAPRIPLDGHRMSLRRTLDTSTNGFGARAADHRGPSRLIVRLVGDHRRC